MRWVERNTHSDALFAFETEERKIGLTIDDGPHPEITPQILDLLAWSNVKATFFLIGERALRYPELVERIVAEGHEIGNHLMFDQPSIQLTPAEFERQLLETHAVLETYAPVRWVRPGSGWYNRRMLAAARKHAYRCVIGSVYPYDAQVSNVPFIVNYVLGNTFPGSIILLHDGTDDRWHTLDVLSRVLPTLRAQGYQFYTLSQLEVQVEIAAPVRGGRR